MYYFFHGTTFESFKQIIKHKHIYASFYLPHKLKKFIRMSPDTKYVYTNIFMEGLPLRDDERAGHGEITFIIDPLILKYKTGYLNKSGWAYSIDNSIIINDNIDYALQYIKEHYKYPHVFTHEVLFKKSISIKFIIGIICEPPLQDKVRQYLNIHGYDRIKIFNKFPVLI